MISFGQMQPDHSLSVQTNVPAPGKSVTAGPIDISVSGPMATQQKNIILRITWPALPALVSPTDNVTVTLQDSLDGLVFANAAASGGQNSPTISVVIPGVAVTGAAAGFSDIPLGFALRGPIGILVSASAGTGDCTAAIIDATCYA